MKSEELRMFNYASMIKAVAFCATTFAFLSVVFKNSIVLVPEVTEIRLCNILACCYGLWFGPAGAWGCAIGNLVGDMAGSLTWLSVFGFTGNFLSAWIPYKIWGVQASMFGENQLDRPSMKSKKWALRYLICAFVSVVACGCILAVPFDLSHSLAAANTFDLIFLNNMGAEIVGLVLFVVMSRIPKNILPYWRDMMFEEKKKVYGKKHRNKVALQILISVAASMYYLIYSTTNNIGLAQMDEYERIIPVAIAAFTLVVIVAATIMCQWKEEQSKSISLD